MGCSPGRSDKTGPSGALQTLRHPDVDPRRRRRDQPAPDAAIIARPGSSARCALQVFRPPADGMECGHPTTRIGGPIMMEFLKNLQRDESGQDLIEYALIAALIALAAVAGMKTVGTGIASAFDSVTTKLSAALT